MLRLLVDNWIAMSTNLYNTVSYLYTVWIYSVIRFCGLPCYTVCSGYVTNRTEPYRNQNMTLYHLHHAILFFKGRIVADRR